MPSPGLVLDPDQPWTWKRQDVLGLLDSRQRDYCESLEHLFRIKRADGSRVDYKQEPYQIWWHAHSPLAMGKKAPNRITEKGRGVGATNMVMMDALMLAHSLDGVEIPVAGRQSKTGDEAIEKAHWLCQDTQIDGFFDPDPRITSWVALQASESSITSIPGGSPHSARSKRSPMSVLDEFAFHPYAREIRQAIRGLHTEGGQMNILSTHNGADSLHYEMVENARNGSDFMLFTLPLHSHAAYTPSEPISVQVADGRLRLVSPWVSLKLLDEMVAEDPAGYEQEMLARVMDEALSVLPRSVVEAAEGEQGQAWEVPFPVSWLDRDDVVHNVAAHEGAQHLLSHGYASVARPAGNTNPCGIGIDFASKGDYAVFTLWEWVDSETYVQRALVMMTMTDTPAQFELLRAWVESVRPSTVFIDMTGPGTGLYELASHLKGVTVVGVAFGGKASLTGGEGRVPVKKALALTLSRILRGGFGRLVGRDHAQAVRQGRHLLSVRRASLDAPRKDGHGDAFWASALALYGLEVSPRGGGDMGLGLAGLL